MENFDDLSQVKKLTILSIAKSRKDINFLKNFISGLSIGETVVLFEKIAEWGNVDYMLYMMNNVPNSHEIFYNTGALSLAAKFGHDDAVSELLKFGVNTNYPDRYTGTTAMENAIIFGREDIYNVLYPVVDLKKTNKNHDTYPQIMLKSLKDQDEYGFLSEGPRKLYNIFTKIVFDTRENINNVNDENKTVFDLLQENKNFFGPLSDVMEEEMFLYGLKFDKRAVLEANINKLSRELGVLHVKINELKTKNSIFDKENERLLSMEFKNTIKSLDRLAAIHKTIRH